MEEATSDQLLVSVNLIGIYIVQLIVSEQLFSTLFRFIACAVYIAA